MNIKPNHLLRAPLSLCSIALLLVLSTPAHAARRAAAPSVVDVRVSHDTYKAHSEPDIAENPRNHKNLIAGSKFFTDPAHYRFKIGTYYSMDGGQSWHDSGLLPGFDNYSTTSDISFAYSATGIAYACVLAVQGNTSGIFVSRSTDGGKTFSHPVPVFLDTTGTTFSDKPWITVDQTHGPTAGTIYVAWNLDGNRDADAGGASTGGVPEDHLLPNQTSDSSNVGLVVSRSIDGGRTFSPPLVISRFDPEFVIGAIPRVAPNGHVYIVFGAIDNRSGNINQLEMVASSDRGVTFSDPQVIQDNVDGLPNHLSQGTFRNLSLPTFAVSPKDGSMVVAWSDMRNSDADILASTSIDGGATWSKPYRVNHDALGNGKDQFQPVIAVAPNGTYTCAWFDRRRDPNNRLIDEYIAQSQDGGKTFGLNLRVTDKSWNPAIDAPEPEGKPSNTFIGDYQGLAVDNLTVHPLWNDTQNGRTQEISTAVVSVRLFARH